MKAKEPIIWVIVLVLLMSLAIQADSLAAVMALAFTCSALVVRLVAAVVLRSDGRVGGPPNPRPTPVPRKTIRIVPSDHMPNKVPYEHGSGQDIPIRTFLSKAHAEVVQKFNGNAKRGAVLVLHPGCFDSDNDTYPDW